MVRLSPSAVMDGGYVVSACVFRPQRRSVTTRYSAVTTANDLGPGEPPRVSYPFPIVGRMARCQAGATTSRPGRRRSGWSVITWVTTPPSGRRLKAVYGRLGMSAETLRKWLSQSEVEDGQEVA